MNTLRAFPRGVLALLAFGSVAACGQSDATSNTADSEIGTSSTLGESSTASAQTAGERAFLKCRSCHTLEEGGRQMGGPNLHGMFGAQAGQKEGFAFSSALSESGLLWDDATMDAWLESPRELVPGNKMAFAGITDKEEREVMQQYSQYEIAGSAAFAADFDLSRRLISGLPETPFGSATSLRSVTQRDLAWGLARHGDGQAALASAKRITTVRERIHAISRILRVLAEPGMEALPRYL